VYAPEDAADGAALLELDNVILTPHTGGSTEEALERTALQVVEQVLDVLAGRRPTNLVDPAAWSQRRR
jgi:phosphoglycerate dehydrogenase-like enzyme